MELEQSEALLQTEEHLLMLTTAQLEVTARGWGLGLGVRVGASPLAAREATP